MNRETIKQALNRLAKPLNELNWKGQIIEAFDDLTAHNLALLEENGKLKAERDDFKKLATVSDESCVILIKSLEALRKTISEKTLNIEYLHKAMDAQQKALDSLRQADLPPGFRDKPKPTRGTAVVSASPPFDPTKTGSFRIIGGLNPDMPPPPATFTQSGRCRARQLLNDLSTNPVQGYAGHRESQLVDVLLLILDELPPVRAKTNRMTANGIVRT